MFFFAPNHDVGKVKEISRSFSNVPFFSLLCPPLFWSCSAGLLCEKVKQHPVLYDKKIKRCAEKGVVSNAQYVGAKDLEYIENGKSNFILFFMLYLG